jgi:alcohol dehydrogenase
MVAYADATQLLPNGLSYDQAAPIFCAGYTVFSGLRFADLKPHERVAGPWHRSTRSPWNSIL